MHIRDQCNRNRSVVACETFGQATICDICQIQFELSLKAPFLRYNPHSAECLKMCVVEVA